MRPAVLISRAEPDVRATIEDLIERARLRDGSRPLSDHLWIDLQSGGGAGFLGAVAYDETETTVGYAQASPTAAARSIEVVVDPSVDHPGELTERLLARMLDAIAHEGGGTATWWVADASPAHADIAERVGLRPDRELLQMRRPLPTGIPVTIDTRPFVPGADDEAWLDVNNRAFTGHGEQSGWDLEQLRSRFAEPWFDPSGFLLHERDGRVAGFCWTKLHSDIDPPLGEIYVIAVDPDFHGVGLGAQLTLAGLASIHDRGISTGMLYVDGGNTPAVSLYRKLGFEVHRTDLAFTADLSPSGDR